MAQFAAVEALQRESFPPRESYEMERILQLAESPNIEYRSFWEDDTLCGILFYNVGETMLYLFYLAVNPALRSKGYGGRLLALLKAEYADKAVVGNIEPVGFNSDNEQQRVRRLAFYERNGFHRLPYWLDDDSGLYDIISSGDGFCQEEYMRLITELGFDAYHPKLINIQNNNMHITTFKPENIDEVARMAAEVWGKDQGAHEPETARLFCQHLSRYSLYSTELALQAEDEEGLQAIAFAWLPGDVNDADQWLAEHLPLMIEEQRHTLRTNEGYLKRTDAELQSKMQPNSAKLSFFISRKPGFGTPLLEALIDLLRQRGIEWLYLWTDITCNWQYYPKHGYEEIGQGIVPEFSTVGDEYVYRMFRKRIG